MNFKSLLKKFFSSSAFKKLICFICIVVIIGGIGVIVSTKMKENNKTGSETGFYFDTVVTIEIYDSDSSISSKDLLENCFKMCETYDSMFDMYDEGSEIYELNNAGGKHTSVSEDTVGILNMAKFFSELTDGVYDATIGSVSLLWDFDSEDPVLPDDEDIKNALDDVNYKTVVLYYDSNEVVINNPNARVDVGALAKGYVSNEIKTYLEEQGVTSAMINLGGNIELIGCKTDGSDFTIGVQKPFGEDEETICSIDAKDVAIVTSGVYERYFYIDDTLYSHLLSSETGYPIDNDLLSVTVIADTGLDGDGLSTCAMLLGLEDGLALVEDYVNAEAIFVTTDYEIILTSGLEQNGDTITLSNPWSTD